MKRFICHPRAALLACLLVLPASRSRGAEAPPPLRPPPGAVVLFGGTNLSFWKHYSPATDQQATFVNGGPGYRQPEWKIAGNAMEAAAGSRDIITRHEFGNYELHLDFLIPAGQGGGGTVSAGAGGVFLSGRYEISLAASSGSKPGKSSCGAINGLKAPDSDSARKPGVWQALDVSYTHLTGQPPTISVWLNGVLVQKEVKAPKPTPGGFNPNSEVGR